jgi:hypothetical protein
VAGDQQHRGAARPHRATTRAPNSPLKFEEPFGCHALIVDGRLIVVEFAQELASWATAAGAVIAAVGLLLTARQLKIQNRQHRLELGTLYINRFWSVDDELTMTDPATEPERYNRLRIRYLKLCEDEFDVAGLGWLDPQQWAVWHSAYLRPSLHAELESAVLDHGDDLDLRSLKACLAQTASAGPHDPRTCSALATRLN